MPKTQVPPIAAGYAYAIQVRVTGAGEPLFPLGSALRADVRAYVGAREPAGTLTSEDGTLVRVDDDTVELRLSGEVTGRIGNSSAVLDLVRTDVSPDQWVGVQVQLPVVEPVTQPGDDA